MNATDEFIRILQNLITRQDHSEQTLVNMIAMLASNDFLSPQEAEELGEMLKNRP